MKQSVYVFRGESRSFQVSSRISKTGKEWAKQFSLYNSGTYNNQWIVVDYKKFRAGKPLPKSGVLSILEQLPWVSALSSMSSEVSSSTRTRPTFSTRRATGPATTYRSAPSSNGRSSYYKKIYDNTQSAEMAAKYGDFFIYDRKPRAQIFRRDHKGINDISGLRKLMRRVFLGRKNC